MFQSLLILRGILLYQNTRLQAFKKQDDVDEDVDDVDDVEGETTTASKLSKKLAPKSKKALKVEENK